MKKENLMKYVGSMQQVAYVRPITYTEGRSHGLSAYEIKNGCMELQVMADKALDVNQLSYKGININFLSKPGLPHIVPAGCPAAGTDGGGHLCGQDPR